MGYGRYGYLNVGREEDENPLDFGAFYFQTDPYDGFFHNAAIKKSLRNLIVAGRGIKPREILRFKHNFGFK